MRWYRVHKIKGPKENDMAKFDIHFSLSVVMRFLQYTLFIQILKIF